MKKVTSSLFIFVLLLPIISAISLQNVTFSTQNLSIIFGNEQEECYKITIDANAHEKYGLGYPITYKFSIPSSLSNAKAYYKYSEQETWKEIPIREGTEIFNGVEAVRFDYKTNFAYVSISFDDVSNDIFLKITDENEANQEITFQEICKYYDNRRMVVVVSGDDLLNKEGRYKEFDDFCGVFREGNLWTTVGAITNSPKYGELDWEKVQNIMDKGMVEVASHSRYHSKPAETWEEIYGSKQDIIENLNLPWQYKKGDKQYVPAFLEPYSTTSALQRQNLAKADYLADRDGLNKTLDYSFTKWVEGELYDRVRCTLVIEKSTLEELNHNFDKKYKEGGIYHIMCHPNVIDLDVVMQHISHIDEKIEDIWSVGFGALYMYHYVQERCKVEVTKNKISPKIWNFDSITLHNDSIELNNGNDTEGIKVIGQCTVVMKVWDPDNRDINATIAKWKIIESEGCVTYEITNLEKNSKYDVWINNYCTYTIFTDKEGTFRCSETSLTPYILEIKYGGII